LRSCTEIDLSGRPGKSTACLTAGPNQPEHKKTDSPQLRPLGGAIILNATGIVILRSLGVQVDDIFAAGLPEFRRHDGRVRVNFDIDMELLKQAGVTGWQSGTRSRRISLPISSHLALEQLPTLNLRLIHYLLNKDLSVNHFFEQTIYPQNFPSLPTQRVIRIA
jgi:hypothetical protein